VTEPRRDPTTDPGSPATRPRGLRAGLVRRADGLLALVLAAVTAIWLVAVEDRQGIGRDEAQYFRAGQHYWTWFAELGDNLAAGSPRRSFTPGAIDRHWGDNPEHPPVMKTLYGLSWRVFHSCTCTTKGSLWTVAEKHRTLPLFRSYASALRFPAILVAGLGAALVYLLARRWLGRAAAATAALLSVAQPHYFFHAQISAFDAPITVMAVAVGYAYWRSLRSAKWGLLCGLVFGLALGVKHNAWLMPFFLVGHYLWIRRGDLRRLRPPRVPLAFVSMAIVGPLVLLALWPRLWPDPVGRTRWYVLRHVKHEHYNFEYLGRNWNNPPKELDRQLVRASFPFVATAVTVPVTTLALAAAGALALARRRRRTGAAGDLLSTEPAPDPAAPRASWLRPGTDVDLAPGAFLAVQILGPMLVIALPAAPIFGGVKHFMPAMPYLSIVAGVGFAWLLQTLRGLAPPRLAGRALPPALAAVACLPAVLETRRSHPDGLSHYNLLAGGFAGGASLGMNRQFWGYSVRPMLPWIAAHAPASGAIYWHDVMPDALVVYTRDGRMPPLGNVGGGEEAVAPSDMALIVHERHFVNYEGLVWESYKTTKPAHVREREGVPIVTTYKRPGAP
jgi:hypothetical protein